MDPVSPPPLILLLKFAIEFGKLITKLKYYHFNICLEWDHYLKNNPLFVISKNFVVPAHVREVRSSCWTSWGSSALGTSRRLQHFDPLMLCHPENSMKKVVSSAIFMHAMSLSSHWSIFWLYLLIRHMSLLLNTCAWGLTQWKHAHNCKHLWFNLPWENRGAYILRGLFTSKPTQTINYINYDVCKMRRLKIPQLLQLHCMFAFLPTKTGWICYFFII